MSNPRWLAVLKAMVRKGIEVGLDGFNATHHYESLCHCRHCCDYARRYLGARLTQEEVQAIYGCADLEEVPDVFTARPDWPAGELAARLRSASSPRDQPSSARIPSTRSSSSSGGPSTRTCCWRSGITSTTSGPTTSGPCCRRSSWARGEDYLWYSQGPSKAVSSLSQGYLADMGLPSRFLHAAGGGRPFVINKYDYRRWRIWAAEAMAHHGTALAFHAGPPRLDQEESANVAPEDYYGPVIRCQRFMFQQEKLLHPADSWSQIALVYPRRAEMQAEMDCLDALKRLGQHLEDGHWLFDIILDDQLIERAGDYEVLVLPEVRRLTAAEGERLEEFVGAGGHLVFTGNSGRLDGDGSPREEPLLQSLRVPPAAGSIGGLAAGAMHIPDGPWAPETLPIKGLQQEMPIYPPARRTTPSGSGSCWSCRSSSAGPGWSRTRPGSCGSAPGGRGRWMPWSFTGSTTGRTRRPPSKIPLPVGPLQAECEVPEGYRVERVEWRYPEMREPVELEHEERGSTVRFTIPTLIVHGMSVLHLEADCEGIRE